jgi:hypothetical protein
MQARHWWLAALILGPIVVLATFVLLGHPICPAGGSCSLDPTDQVMGVRIVNDSPAGAIVDHLSCPPQSCDHDPLPAGKSLEVGTSDRGVDNAYRVRLQSGTVLGCFHLLYHQRPPVEPVVLVSQASPC